MTEETKGNIDDMNYRSMFQLWRFAPSEHPYFQGEIGAYFTKSMKEKRSKLTDKEHTHTSKEIGW